jgi:hypothetical protein
VIGLKLQWFERSTVVSKMIYRRMMPLAVCIVFQAMLKYCHRLQAPDQRMPCPQWLHSTEIVGKCNM